jgi:hypothetical protein
MAQTMAAPNHTPSLVSDQITQSFGEPIERTRGNSNASSISKKVEKIRKGFVMPLSKVVKEKPQILYKITLPSKRRDISESVVGNQLFRPMTAVMTYRSGHSGSFLRREQSERAESIKRVINANITAKEIERLEKEVAGSLTERSRPAN